MPDSVLIVEDERTALRSLSVLLADEGYRVLEAMDGEAGLQLALHQEPDLVLVDIRLPGMDGLTLIERLRAGGSDAAVLVMTAETTSRNAIRATQLGAFDYLAKPIDVDHLLVVMRRALAYQRLEREVQTLRKDQQTVSFPSLVGHSPAMQSVYKQIGRVAASTATVLITGESGTGKELVAHAVHEHSLRAQGPLIKLNCAAIPETLIDAELFGHERGAFTGAAERRIGRFEQAHGGTLFLDEIAELPVALQAKLLRAVQERVVDRLGGSKPVPVDFRLITATAQDLEAAVAAGRFREDLYWRLHVVRIHLPPLRDRREDIPPLVERFLARSAHPATIHPAALDRLASHDWPGNVRELENVMARSLAVAPGGVITAESIELPSHLPSAAPDWLAQVPHRDGFWPVLHRVEAHLLRMALLEAEGNKARAAGLLGIQRRLLYDKMREHGIV